MGKYGTYHVFMANTIILTIPLAGLFTLKVNIGQNQSFYDCFSINQRHWQFSAKVVVSYFFLLEYVQSNLGIRNILATLNKWAIMNNCAVTKMFLIPSWTGILLQCSLYDTHGLQMPNKGFFNNIPNFLADFGRSAE